MAAARTPAARASAARPRAGGLRRARLRPARLRPAPTLVVGLLGVCLVSGCSSSTGPGAGAAVTTPAVSVSAPGATLPGSAPEVLAALGSTAPRPDPAALQRLLLPLTKRAGLGPRVAVDVVDTATGIDLMSLNATQALLPASTVKLLTGAAVLVTLGPDATLPTRVVSGPANQIVLVGGGDVLLAAGHGDPGAVIGHAGLADLAAQTAATMRAQGMTTASVRLDDSLFGGPLVNSAWQPGDVAGGFVSPVQALEVNAGMPAKGADRSADPALAAAGTFAALLAHDGIKVTGSVGRGRAPGGAPVLAEVQSAAVADLVEHDLTVSDNTVAEALARLVALHVGRPATFAGASAAVLAQVKSLGVDVSGVQLSGGSGLGNGTTLTAHALTQLLVLAATSDHAGLRALITGLPVAGASGTLSDRFGASAQQQAIGMVRAKTGTLTGVSSLAGLVVDADGRLLAFAVLADRTTSTTAARTALDAIGATLAGCGCH